MYKDQSVYTVCLYKREGEKKQRVGALRRATAREPEDVQQLSCQPHKQPRCQIHSNKEPLNM